MSYSQPATIVTYTFPAMNFVSGAGAYAIKAPPGVENGRVDQIHLRATTTFTATTTAAKAQLGISGAAAKYAEVPLGTLAAGASLSNTKAQRTAAGERIRVEDGDTLLTLVAPTGGSPAGVADVQVTIAWF